MCISLFCYVPLLVTLRLFFLIECIKPKFYIFFYSFGFFLLQFHIHFSLPPLHLMNNKDPATFFYHICNCTKRKNLFQIKVLDLNKSTACHFLTSCEKGIQSDFVIDVKPTLPGVCNTVVKVLCVCNNNVFLSYWYVILWIFQMSYLTITCLCWQSETVRRLLGSLLCLPSYRLHVLNFWVNYASLLWLRLVCESHPVVHHSVTVSCVIKRVSEWMRHSSLSVSRDKVERVLCVTSQVSFPWLFQRLNIWSARHMKDP